MMHLNENFTRHHERITGLGTGVSGQHLVPKLTFTDLCETKVKVDNIEHIYYTWFEI